MICRRRCSAADDRADSIEAAPAPRRWDIERPFRLMPIGKVAGLSDTTLPHQSCLLRRYPLQQGRGGFVRRVLRHQLPPHREVQHEAAQPGDGVGRVGDAVVEGEQALGVHGASASARIAFNWPRSAATSPSAVSSAPSSVSASPWSSSTACGAWRRSGSRRCRRRGRAASRRGAGRSAAP